MAAANALVTVHISQGKQTYGIRGFFLNDYMIAHMLTLV